MRNPVARKNPSSLTEMIYDRLRHEIITCTLPPGAEVSEAELASRFRVSKTPVREALNTLRSERFVLAYPRRGYRVAPLTVANIDELFTVRGVLEGGAVELASRRMSPGGLEKLERYVNTAYERAEQPSLRLFVRTNRDFHLAIARIAGNVRLEELIARHLDELERVFYLGAWVRDIGTEVANEHHAIVDKLARGEAEAARGLMVEHILRTRDAIMKLLIEPPDEARSLLASQIDLAAPRPRDD